ncbi:MAG: hypothetical protein IJX53_04455 [Clostridia bacterium]|nr:hypothetical protein [Clostridia bacterium]
MKIKLTILLLVLVLVSCDAPPEIEETTLDLYAWVVEDGDIIYRALEQGVVYQSAWETAVLPEGTGCYNYSLTAETNGTLQVTAPDGGVNFGWGEVQQNITICQTGVDHTYQNYHGGTFTFWFEQLQAEETWERASYPPDGTSRIITLSAWEGDNAELTGDPRVTVTMRLVYDRDRREKDMHYTLEILSIERTTPAYW